MLPALACGCLGFEWRVSPCQGVACSWLGAPCRFGLGLRATDYVSTREAFARLDACQRRPAAG
eukprot:3302640-Prymnesium_polylepis.1